MCYNTVEPWKRDATGKKRVTKDLTSCDSIHMKHPKYANLWRQKVDWWLPEAGRDRKTGDS